MAWNWQMVMKKAVSGPTVDGIHVVIFSQPQSRLVRVFVEQLVADAQIPLLLVGIAVNAPETVLLLAPQSLLGGMETGVCEVSP